jgi:hypothetical protein
MARISRNFRPTAHRPPPTAHRPEPRFLNHHPRKRSSRDQRHCLAFYKRFDGTSMATPLQYVEPWVIRMADLDRLREPLPTVHIQQAGDSDEVLFVDRPR